MGEVFQCKESSPNQVTKYVIAQGIWNKPAFNWWVHHVLKKRERIISMVEWHSAQFLKRNNKFGLRLPKTVNEVAVIDKKNGNTL